MNAVSNYFASLNAAVGQAWNRFWFTPSRATVLGLIRIATGVLAFYAIATYGPDLDRWFGPGGMLPLNVMRQPHLYPDQWSALDYVPADKLWLAYWIALAVIGLFTLGVGGRIVAILATIATLSFFSRAPLLTGEFESILSFLMVYLCIGNSTDEFSLPAFLRSRSPSAPPTSGLKSPASPLNTISLRLIQVHIVIVHLMMGWSQLSAPESAWWTGEGIYLAAMRPDMALVDFSRLSAHPRIVAAWSHLITLDLLAFPILVWPRIARPLAVAVGAFVWLSLALATGWVLFCAAMLVGIASFVEFEPAPQA